MDVRPQDAAELVERAARALFERRSAHTGLRFDALPVWAQWVRESYLADAHAALTAAGVLAPPAGDERVGDRYERLAQASVQTAGAVATSPATGGGERGRRAAPAHPLASAPMVGAGAEVLLLTPDDVDALGRTGIVSSLHWAPGAHAR
ncbi:hypothetical protein KIN34_13450 [Cellulomonas sp. DKR-3]|uniref:Uncharacterized protein n=1 Tax=Cellulomonas fulva TaxID=2835530 RepID=A0ABS5U1L3_9CELL|nr:hypothetical protein [Cellulomonas fulva]MBT0995290.1 hypothetical protein [Cellulomonas fulva]